MQFYRIYFDNFASVSLFIISSRNALLAYVYSYYCKLVMASGEGLEIL